MRELRDTMIISLFDRLNSERWIGGALGLLLYTLFSSPLHALELSSPVGVQQIGKRLDLISSVSGIPPGTDSQLRSTCLTARAKPSGRKGVEAFEGQSSELLQVEFVPTVRQGGMVHFKSRSPINDALIELELVSDCPLLAFKSNWMIIVDANEEGGAGQQTPTQNQPGAAGFDVSNSSLLKASRMAPKRSAVVVTPAKTDPQTQPVVIKAGTASHNQTAMAVEPELAAPAKVEEPLHLAALDQGLSGQGLIESRPSLPVLEAANPAGQNSKWMGFDLSSPAIWVFLVSMALLLLVAIGFGKFQWKQLRAAKVNSVKREPANMASPSLFKGHSEQEEIEEPALAPLTRDLSAFGSDRVLESLMGDADQRQEEPSEGLKPLLNSDSGESLNRSSLSICLELINKADIRAWNLPESYQALVAVRNKSLDLHRTADAMLLRCQVGLVELAFQEARKAKRLPDELAQDLLQLVMGDHSFDLESYSALCVPDVVKSHVRAKMCEISGAEKRQLLQENLINLNTQVTSPALCFHSNAWREFLSEEGIIE